MKSRRDIIDFILRIEDEFNVNSLKFNNIHFWPLIRVKLFFHLIYKIEKESLFFEKKRNEIKSNFLFELFKWPFCLWKINSFKKRTFLFIGSYSHRVEYKGFMFNRFFDSIINKMNIKSKSLIMDYDSLGTGPIFNSDVFLNYNKFFNSFFSFIRFKSKLTKRTPNFNLEEYFKLSDFFLESDFTSDFRLGIDLDFLKFYLNELSYKIDFFQLLLAKTKPKYVFTLCYYSDVVFALNIACSLNKVKSIEVQHGPQPISHAAYSHWTNLPLSGYAMLPNIFWCWDDNSVSILSKWNHKLNNHKAIKFGNPWIDYLEDKSEEITKDDFILYTLQPLAIHVLFTDNLIESIRNSNIKWFIRLHPRQFNQLQDIISFLNDNGLTKFVEIDLASKLPLPTLMKNCLLHISNYSGAIIEAQLLGKFSIIINEIGKYNFKNLINLKQAIYLNSNEITADLIRKYSNNSDKVQKEVEKSNYLNFFDNEC